MTAYFDEAHARLNKIKGTLLCDPPELEARYEIERIENDVVYDCTIASEMDDFPEDLRTEVNRVVLQHGVYTLPETAEQPDFDTAEGHFDRIHKLIYDLHSVFHRVAMRDPQGLYLSDDPRRPMRRLYAKSEERREIMIAEGVDLSTPTEAA